MTESFSLVLPVPKALTPSEEIPLLELACARDAGPDYVLKLAHLLHASHRDDEVIALLSGRALAPAQEHAGHMLLGLAHLGRNRTGDAAAAGRSLERAVGSAPGRRPRATALSELGKSHVLLGQDGPARDTLTAALAEDWRAPYAFSRMTRLDLHERRDRDLLDLADSALANGCADSSVLAGRYLALSGLSQTEAAAHVEAMGDFLWEGMLETPDGWPSLAAFNAALAEELVGHSGRKRPRQGSETGARWRIDDLWLHRSHIVPVLMTTLKARIEQAVAALMYRDHLWCRARPANALLHAWSMTTHDDGFDAWHMHVRGWMSGVYYVQVPDHPDDPLSGCIEFGCPEIPGLDRTFMGARRRIQPRPGQLLLFPSHLHHRTYPTASSERRISVAFDVVPLRPQGSEPA